MKPGLWNVARHKVNPNWAWAWDGLIWGALPGGLWNGDLKGGIGSIFGSTSWGRATTKGVAVGHDSVTGSGVWYYQPGDFQSKIDGSDEITILALAKINALSTGTNNQWGMFLLACSNNDSHSAPYGIFSFHRNEIYSIGRITYATGSSTFTTADSSSGFLEVSNAPILYGVRKKGSSIDFFKDGVIHSSDTNASNLYAQFSSETIVLLDRNRTDTGHCLEADELLVLVYNRALSDAEIQKLTADPFAAFRPYDEAGVVYAVSGDIVQVIGLNTETDAALGLTGAKSKVLGLASETDTAQSITAVKSQTLGLPAETDTAQSLTGAKTKAVGLATGAETALPMTAVKSRTLGLPAETDAAQGVAGAKAKAVGLATETDAALSMTAAKSRAIGQATETNAAQSMTTAKAKAIGQVSETDEALSLVPSATTIGIVTETDTALPMTAVKSKVIGLATETDVGLALTANKSKSLGLVTEADIALALVAVAAIITHRDYTARPRQFDYEVQERPFTRATRPRQFDYEVTDE